MKRILLLAAIYSLIIHQSRKNGKEVMPGIKASLHNEVISPTGVSAGLIAFTSVQTTRIGYMIPR